MDNGAGAPSPPPPSALPKRHNAVLRLFDGPLYRDWMFWMAVGWGLLAAVSILTSNRPSSIPIWLNTLLAVLMFLILFGVLPAWLRLLFRRWRWRVRQQHDRRGESSLPPARTVGAPTAEPFDDGRAAPPPLGDASQRSRPSRQFSPSRPTTPPVDLTRPASHERPPPTFQALATARATLPHPVARAVRTLQRAHTPKDQYEAVLEAAEILAITLAVTGVSLLRGQIDGRVPGDDSQRERARQGLCELQKRIVQGHGATFGTWTHWLTHHLAPIADTQPDLVPGLRKALRDDGQVPGILTDLKALQDERNRASHGDKPRSPQESALRVTECAPRLERALGKAGFLIATPWLLSVSCSYRPSSRTFHVDMQRVTGDHPDFESQSFTWAEPVANDTFYVLSPEGPPLSLAPLVASRLCTQCRQMEVCYASSVDRRTGTPIFKSFDRGHEIAVPELGDEIRALPYC
ncbi:hypothetical protein AB0M57_12760 [Streptomyces sp. NPDC051597]|uniref:hypothetical protein n=1 Tax=Streptomyces sp. NPDC051597 TaxID=3155049 RepID=UPI0034457D19